MRAVLESSEAAILARVIRPDAGDWPQDAAKAILSLGFNQADRDRMTLLLAKAKEGELTEDEATEVEHYRHAGRLLELMKARARRSLHSAQRSKHRRTGSGDWRIDAAVPSEAG